MIFGMFYNIGLLRKRLQNCKIVEKNIWSNIYKHVCKLFTPVYLFSGFVLIDKYTLFYVNSDAAGNEECAD